MDPVKYDPEIVNEYLNGLANEDYLMIKLMMQVIVILIVGIVLWRVASIFSSRSNKRRESVFSDSRFQSHWKNKK